MKPSATKNNYKAMAKKLSEMFNRKTEMTVSFKFSKKPKKAIVRLVDDPITLKVSTKGKNQVELKIASITSLNQKTENTITIEYGHNAILILYINHLDLYNLWTNALKFLVDYKELNSLNKIFLSEKSFANLPNIREVSRTFLSFNINSKSNSIALNKKNVYAFGSNDWGQLGLSKSDRIISRPELSYSMLSRDLKTVGCGWSHTIYILESNDLMQVGSRISTGEDFDLITPKELEMTFNYSLIKVVGGSDHSLAIDDNGLVYSWGCNFFGQCGHEDQKEFYNEPTLIKSMKNLFVINITAGERISGCLTDEGKVYTWGDGKDGGLGHGDEENKIIPTLVKGLENMSVEQFEMGSYHSLAVTKKGIKYSLYSWGWNGFGQLGLGDRENRFEPELVKTNFNGKIRNISLGASHSGATTSFKKFNAKCVYMWGSNKTGQLGLDNSGQDRKPFETVPIPINISQNPEVICCGANHSVILSEENNIFVAGNNIYGQLGVFKNESKTAQNKEMKEMSIVSRGMNSEDPGSLAVMSTGKFDIRKTMIKINHIKQNYKNLSEKKFSSEDKQESSLSSSITPLFPPDMFLNKFTELSFFKDKKICEVKCGGDFTVILTKKEWISDRDVKVCIGKFSDKCKGEFNILNRKHHCRNCGGIFCSACSSKAILLPDVSDSKLCRVCDYCYEAIQK